MALDFLFYLALTLALALGTILTDDRRAPGSRAAPARMGNPGNPARLPAPAERHAGGEQDFF